MQDSSGPFASLVARPVGRKEIESNPDAQKSVDVERKNLESKGAWDYNTLCEWLQVIKEANKGRSEKVHVGKIFEICVEKGSELEKGNPLRKFKGRTVFQGNNAKDENAEQAALFAELGSAPSTMEAAKAIDAYGAMPGNCTQQSDGRQAYTQALHKGVKTWVRLPKYRWPKGWASKFRDPVVQLILALYGLIQGVCGKKHCKDILLSLGFRLIFPGAWPSVFWHPKLRLDQRVGIDFVQNRHGHICQFSGTLDVSILAIRRFNLLRNISHLLMSSTTTSKTHPTNPQLQLAALRTLGNTIRNMAWLFAKTDSLGVDFAARLTVLPKKSGCAGCGTLIQTMFREGWCGSTLLAL